MVDQVSIEGNHNVDDEDITAKIATSETGGALEGVPLVGAIDTLTVEYERFDRFVLERDLIRVARLYRAKGYYEAVVRAGRVRRLDDHAPGDVKNARLLVEIVVEEGSPVLVLDTELVWKDWNPAEAPEAGAAALNGKNRMRPTSIFTEERYLETAKLILRSLTDLGYAYARVEPSAEVDLATHFAHVKYAIELGPKCKFGKVTLEGLGEIPEWQIRPALSFEEGDDYSTSNLESAEVALNDFGVFGAIAIEPQIIHDGPRPTAVPVIIRVQPAKLRSVRLGFGVEVGSQVATRGVAGWQNKNLFGALDRLSIEGRPRLVLYPWKLETLFGSPPRLVPEVAARVEYALPIPYEPRTRFFLQGQGSIGLEKNLDQPDHIDDTTDIPGEYLVEQKVGFDRRFFLSRLLLSLSHNLGFSQPFSYNLEQPTGASQSLLVSYLELYAELDLRKRGKKWDAVNPTSGFFASNDLQVAGYFIGGDANDVKVRPEIRFFAPLTRRVVLAGRFGMGFLFTGNYGTTLDTNPSTASVTGDPGVLAGVDREVQILDKRGLFSGGPNSNRGYGFNEIAPHRVVADDGTSINLDPDAIGGRTLWEATVEVRFPIAGDLSGTSFIDASDVTSGIGDLRIDHPHVSVGVGARYETPVGPLRVDLGVRVPYLQTAGEASTEPCDPCSNLLVDEGVSSTLFELPMALAIAIGNAF